MGPAQYLGRMTGEQQRMVAWGGVAVILFTLLMVFAVNRANPDLDNTSWVVESAVIEGEQTGTIDGTMITADFAAGEVRGFGGCNNYFGGYTTDGTSFDVRELASTEAFCDEPRGVSDQEFVYLSFLQTADGFRIDGDRLVLTLDGEDLLLFRKS